MEIIKFEDKNNYPKVFHENTLKYSPKNQVWIVENSEIHHLKHLKVIRHECTSRIGKASANVEANKVNILWARAPSSRTQSFRSQHFVNVEVYESKPLWLWKSIPRTRRRRWYAPNSIEIWYCKFLGWTFGVLSKPDMHKPNI